MAASPDSGPTGADGDLWKPVLVPVINHAGSFVVTPVFEATTTNRELHNNFDADYSCPSPHLRGSKTNCCLPYTGRDAATPTLLPALCRVPLYLPVPLGACVRQAAVCFGPPCEGLIISDHIRLLQS